VVARAHRGASDVADSDKVDAGHGTLLTMTDRDPELSTDVELRNTHYQLQIYEAIAVATNDAHGALDAVLGASDPDAARRALQHRYGFTELQATAVMDMQFRRVTAIDREKIEQRHQELAARVTALEAELG
jgi:DNA gyrase/topoisomerase IV subunit A